MPVQVDNDTLELKFEVLWPRSLLGADGKWRNNEPNTYGAEDDAGAVRGWLESQQSRVTKASLDAYTRDIEKFVFWAIAIRLKALSSLEPDDLISFKSFLMNPPSNWVESCPFLRAAPQWRPFRKAMGDASALRTIQIVLKMYADWCGAGYLKQDPMMRHRLAIQGPTTDPKLNYWLTRRHWAIILQKLNRIPPLPKQRLLRASLLLLQRAGINCREAVELFYGDLAASGKQSTTTIPPRRGRVETKIVLDEDVMQALLAHHNDRLAYVAEGRLARFADLPQANTPLLSVFEVGLIRDVEPAVPQRAVEKMTQPKLTGDRDATYIRNLVMEFLEEVALHPDLSEQKEKFLACAAHWLRDPARQTETIRREVLIKKHMGIASREVVDEPDVERNEIYAILGQNRWPVPESSGPQ